MRVRTKIEHTNDLGDAPLKKIGDTYELPAIYGFLIDLGYVEPVENEDAGTETGTGSRAGNRKA